MGYRVFIIEHPSSPPLPAWLQDENLCGLSIAGRSLWQDFSGEQISRLQEQIVLASGLPKSEAVWNMFEWLREHPIRVPTLALLPADDPELMRVAASTVDDFLVWPIHAEELRQRVFRLLGPASLKDVQNQLLGEMGMRQALGNAPAFLDALKRVAMFGPSIAPVMLTGETGTGKELFARILHMLSPRCRGPFIPVECGAVPEHLFENEMFGHARGAFTDAHAEQKGCAMLAVGGTLFLDEIDSLSLAAQGKLLRLIQERKFRPLGADQYQEADVRIIAASNRDLAKLVDEKVFRCDLYFRLNVLRVHLPALRERPGDVALLARHFVESLSGSGGAQRKFLSPAALHKLESYHWPGNVRELYNTVQRAVLTRAGCEISSADIEVLTDNYGSAEESQDFRSAKNAAIERFERGFVRQLLEKHSGNVSRAAREAGKDRRAFGRLVKKYDLKRLDN